MRDYSYCLCADPACPSCGPAQGYDLRCQGPAWENAVEAQMENALDHVLETILLFGQYPQPRRPYPSDYPLRVPPSRRIQFDLQEWIDKHIDRAQLVETYAEYIMQDALGVDGHDRHDRQVKQVENMLREELADSEIVREKAEEYAQEQMGEE